jgi:hypothetical protein
MNGPKDLHYPIVHIGRLHTTTFSYKEYEPKLKHVPEKIEYAEPSKEGPGCLTWVIAAAVCLFIGGAAEDTPIGAILLTVGMFVIPIVFGIVNNRASNFHNKAVENYIKHFNERVDERNTVVKKNKAKLEKITKIMQASTKKDALKFIFSDIGAEIDDEQNFKVGASEVAFINRIAKSRLGTMVNHNISVSHNYDCYYPDVAIIDTDNSIFIDIEIDEPYTYLEKLPIHYIGSDKDRDEFFQSIGWTVLRFSEQQIVKQPNEVIDFITAVYYSLHDGIEIDGTSSLAADNRWSEEQSSILANLNYRDTYLK